MPRISSLFGEKSLLPHHTQVQYTYKWLSNVHTLNQFLTNCDHWCLGVREQGLPLKGISPSRTSVLLVTLHSQLAVETYSHNTHLLQGQRKLWHSSSGCGVVRLVSLWSSCSSSPPAVPWGIDPCPAECSTPGKWCWWCSRVEGEGGLTGRTPAAQSHHTWWVEGEGGGRRGRGGRRGSVVNLGVVHWVCTNYPFD